MRLGLEFCPFFYFFAFNVQSFSASCVSGFRVGLSLRFEELGFKRQHSRARVRVRVCGRVCVCANLCSDTSNYPPHSSNYLSLLCSQKEKKQKKMICLSCALTPHTVRLSLLACMHAHKHTKHAHTKHAHKTCAHAQIYQST